MIFLKNILKKNTIKWYLISLISIISGLLLLCSIGIYLNDKKAENNNREIYRTIIFEKNDFVLEQLSHNKNIKDIICDAECKIIVDKYEYVDNVQDVLDSYDIYYENTIPQNEEMLLYNSLNIILPILLLSFILIFSIYIFQFISDDILTIKMLRTIGYNKLNILQKYLLAFLFLFNIIFLFSVFLFLCTCSVLKKFFIIKNMISIILIIYIIIQICIVIIITIKILFLSKKKLL